MEFMNVYEISVKAVCIKDLSNVLAQQATAKAIDDSFDVSSQMKNFHKENKFKNYWFTPLSPFSTGWVYEKGTMVNFKVRTVDEDLK